LDSDISLPNPVINGIFNPSNLNLPLISHEILPQTSNENLPQTSNGNLPNPSNGNLLNPSNGNLPNPRKKKLSDSKPGSKSIPANFTINEDLIRTERIVTPAWLDDQIINHFAWEVHTNLRIAFVDSITFEWIHVRNRAGLPKKQFACLINQDDIHWFVALVNPHVSVKFYDSMLHLPSYYKPYMETFKKYQPATKKQTNKQILRLTI